VPTDDGNGGGMDGTLLRRSFVDFAMRIQYFFRSMGRTQWFIAAGVILCTAHLPGEANSQDFAQFSPRSSPELSRPEQTDQQSQNQSRSSLTPGTTRELGIEHKPVFTSIEQGLVAGSPDPFVRHLATRLHVSLPEGQSGHFSADQAYYLLEGYLQKNSMSGFRFTLMDTTGAAPYATGGTPVNVKGAEKPTQVYVSLSYVAERWVITKISIY
jgi:hypothetical protein